MTVSPPWIVLDSVSCMGVLSFICYYKCIKQWSNQWTKKMWEYYRLHVTTNALNSEVTNEPKTCALVTAVKWQKYTYANLSIRGEMQPFSSRKRNELGPSRATYNYITYATYIYVQMFCRSYIQNWYKQNITENISRKDGHKSILRVVHLRTWNLDNWIMKSEKRDKPFVAE